MLGATEALPAGRKRITQATCMAAWGLLLDSWEFLMTSWESCVFVGNCGELWEYLRVAENTRMNT